MMVPIGLLMIASIFVYPLLLLRPLTKRLETEHSQSNRGRFFTTDIFSLMFLVQLPYFLCLNFGADLSRLDWVGAVVVHLGFLFVALAVWYAGLRTMNHLGIDSQLKRIIGIAYTMPAAVLGGTMSPGVIAGSLYLITAVMFNEFEGVEREMVAPGVVFAVLTLLTYVTANWIARDKAELAVEL